MQDICKKVFKIRIDLTPIFVNPISGIGPKGTKKLVLIALNKSIAPKIFQESNNPQTKEDGFFNIA